nr:MAG TPA: Regulatory phage protein cox [Caudoviricetes sp.]
MARIRTIPKAVAAIKENDPDTYITAALVRRWVRQGVIKTVGCNSGYQLIDLDQLERYLECGADDNS